ncbi:beta-ketoacyl synthase domain-containing protein [Trichoderma aethiopicum]
MSKPEQDAPEPIAVIGFACRLPGGNYSPHQLWDFLERGDIAWNGVPPTRFNLSGHYDGSMKPKTMRQPGGMFLKDIDLADFDAGFFEVGTGEATAMDPNQRQILEVVYEGLENAGIQMEKLDNQVVGCYVGSYGVDYADMASRDPEDRPLGNVVGIARCVMANRISHFFNLKGPSITLDTACSGSLVGLDLACQNLRSGTIKMGIVATSNLYMSPEHVIDAGNVGGAHSPTALCHTFDVAADGYVKAEAVSTAIVKRLSDAIRDRDPIRGIVLGTASNHNGRTAGIASPNAEAQALAIRAAYANAGISDYSQTTFLECHGTGTQAGDANEVRGIASVFAAGRSDDTPLIIGSIKSNVGHSEPAAGLSGLMKAIMSIEKGAIPGNPTFITPNPKIDFAGAKVKVSRALVKWPENAPRRASINSFGIGGSNAHAIVEQVNPHDAFNHTSSYIDVEKEFDTENHEASRPSVLVLSANDAVSLSANIKAFCTHLINPRVKLDLSRLFHRAFVTTATTDIREDDFTVAKSGSQPPKIGFIFTGQGAQWAQMGKDLLEMFPWTRKVLEELDQVLQAQPDPPTWSLIAELTESRTAKHMRQPDISQTLVTALQLCIFAVLESWNIKPTSVVGHSSGECAAAYASGWLDRAGALKAAFYRGRAALNRSAESEKDVGMLAVGLGAKGISEFLEGHKGSVSIACYNSPNSLTLSGKKPALEDIASKVKAAGHFARMLLVDMAYHSQFMDITGEEYQRLLETDDEFLPLAKSASSVKMFSSVTGVVKDNPADSPYWLANMSSPVRFDKALGEMIDKESPTLLVEIGPSGALAGPVAQILKALPNGKDVTYCSSWARGSNACKSLFDVAGRIFATGGSIDLSLVNDYKDTVRTIIDLPNYSWNHSVKYWHESAASKDWRFRKFPVHDLLGSKILGTPWTSPVWRHTLNVANVPWILDHKMGGDAIMPGAGFLTLGLEALYQKQCALSKKEAPASANELCYRFRNVRFNRALVLEEDKDVHLVLSLSQVPGSRDWHEFRISSTEADVEVEHCFGLVRIQDPVDEKLDEIAPLEHPQNAKQWYKAECDIGMDFGPDFQKLVSIEATSGSRSCRTLMSLAPPDSRWSPQSYYPVHPAALDGCFQTPIPANAVGERVNVRDVMIPAMFDDVLINSVPSRLHEGISYATSVYSGRGRPDQDKSWKANSAIYDSATGRLVVRVTGINYVKLDVAPKPDPHVFDRISWQPDISLLTQDQMIVIDLVAHKKPALRVLEINLDEADTSTRVAYSQYDFASADAKSLVAVQTQHGGADGTSFSVMRPDIEGLGLSVETAYDLIIVKSSTKNLKPLLAADALTLMNHSPRSPGTPPTSWGSDGDRPSSSLDSAASDLGASKSAQGDFGSPERFSKRHRERIREPSRTLTIGATDDGSLGFLLRNMRKAAYSSSNRKLLVANLKGTTRPSLGPSLQATLSASGWEITQQTCPFPAVPAETVVLIVDELSHHVLRHANEQQWEAVKALVTSGNPLLWVTKGSQHPVTDPDNALVHGLFRVARQEDQSLKLTTLDVQSSTSRATEWAIDRVLQLLAQDASPETQYMERDGILHIQRLIPDADVNDFKRAEVEGLEPVSKSFHNNEAQIMLRTERIGTLQSLTWCETDVEELPLEPNWVEIEVRAGGVNFKDVAITMGIVADNEFTIGVECAGPIRRIGSNVTKFKVGDRVCVLKPGTYANRAHAEADRCHLIPDAMTYEEAATIPSVYLCSLYSLYHLANIQRGQSVLIHSATGGVGIACIGLARYRGAEIYVTVGTEEKREFLEKHHGIPRSRMYSSRNADFASEIMRETDGRGIDVIVNSLTGELLDASWRIVADGGTMVEIGKRDIIDRNTLAMEPFDRNCSFRAVDMSYGKHMDEKKVARLFEELFALINAGHLQPIHPVTTFGFDQIPAALAHIRAGRHMGKIIISNQETEDLHVPVRPAVRKLKLLPDASYLVVGGLRGACGTLVVHMAQHGARHIVVNNRGGIQDTASAKVVRDCLSYGCVVKEARGDVGDYEAVSRIFKDTVPRIAGVVHGPMVLNDKPYENMTANDYHSTLHAKVNGAWNLHRASTQLLKQPLDFFTMLSSISGIVGRKGQANYAAANTFLDAFASYRQLQGLRANAADLGMIVDVGHIADDETGLEDKFDKTRWIPVNEAMLRRILTYSILQQDPNTQLNRDSSAQLITGISYPLSPDESHLVYDTRFSYLYAGRGKQVGSYESSDRGDKGDQALRTFQVMHKSDAGTASLVNACVEALSGQFAKILQLLGPVEPGKPLMAYGLDSLSAIELRNWTRAKMGVELTTLDIINASSLIALGEKVVSKLTQSEDAGN